MITKHNEGVYLLDGGRLCAASDPTLQKELASRGVSEQQARAGTMAHGILQSHNTAQNDALLHLRFDTLTSHDITYVGIVQTARASGLTKFPVPYVLTNCHNSLCAVGGTINEDDHLFGLSAAKKYGGIYVPAHGAVIHQYMREEHAACGKMILGSDSHTRYGALGTLAIGEGGPELVKQLLSRTYDIAPPAVVAVKLVGDVAPGVGPQDVALALIGATFPDGFVKNSVLEFVGDGVNRLSMEFRIGIDVMTTETACLSSIWVTDEKTKDFFATHKRADAYRRLEPAAVSYYDRAVEIDLSKIRPMIAMPFHPSHVYTVQEVCENTGDLLREIEKTASVQLGKPYSLTDQLVNGKLQVAQGIIAGCAGGTYENICDAADILRGHSIGADAFTLSVYPASQPVNTALMQNGAYADLMQSGAVIKTAFCGPCFGAGDVPANNTLSIRHTTRNFPSREGAKPGDGQIAAVALMDARSIAASAANGGVLTPATQLDVTYTRPAHSYDTGYYESRVYQGYGKADAAQELRFGPNIKDWPTFIPLPENLLLQVASVIDDPVTTTDELIPSGETSSYRSNPERLSQFALSRKDPQYVPTAKAVRTLEQARQAGTLTPDAGLQQVLDTVHASLAATGLGSVIFANKPGDGSAREQAASCQRVLGGCANIAQEYATKRYRSNLINWGMLPLLTELCAADFAVGDYVFFPSIRDAIAGGDNTLHAKLVHGTDVKDIAFTLGSLSINDRAILLAGCLMNYYKQENAKG